MQTKMIERYFFFGLFLATFIFTFFIFQPFWIVMVLGISFAIVLRPLYNWFIKKHLPKGLSSFVTVLIFTLVLCGPILGIGVIVFNQSQDLYQSVVEAGGVSPFVETINNSINKILPTGVDFRAQEKVSDFILFITENTAKIFTSTLSAFFAFTLMLLAMYYFLKDGEHWKKYLIHLSPLADKDDQEIISRLKNAVNGVVKGYLLIGIIQGIFVGIGLSIFGVPNPALWGVIAGIASLIPMIGTGFVTLPAIVYLLLGGHTLSAVGLLIWSASIVGMVDNLLSPILIGKKINIPPLLILFSVLGGIALLGPIGVLVGPLTLSLLYTLISIYKSEFQGSSDQI